MQRYPIQYCSVCSVVLLYMCFPVVSFAFTFSACVSDRRLIQANLGTFRLKPKHARYVLFCFVFIRNNGTKTEQCFLYHCSVFLFHCPVFALLFHFFTTEQKRNSVFCTTVPCFRTTVPFLHHCSIFSQQNKNGTVYFVPLFRVFVPLFSFCTTVPFLHYCSFFCTTVPFFPQWDKNRTLYFVQLHCVFVPLFCFFTIIPFFHNVTKTEQCVFVPLFRFFLQFCSVFPQQNKNGTVYFVPLFRVFVPLFHFFTTVPFIPQQNKNGTVYFVPLFRVFVPLFRFCTTVPFFFALLFHFFHYCSIFSTTEQKRNSVFCTTVLCLFTTVLFFHYCSIFPEIEGTSHSVSQRQRNETFLNRKGNK